MGVWGATPMNTGVSQVFIEGDPQRRFAYFAAVGKVGRPAGRNTSLKIDLFPLKDHVNEKTLHKNRRSP